MPLRLTFQPLPPTFSIAACAGFAAPASYRPSRSYTNIPIETYYLTFKTTACPATVAGFYWASENWSLKFIGELNFKLSKRWNYNFFETTKENEGNVIKFVSAWRGGGDNRHIVASGQEHEDNNHIILFFSHFHVHKKILVFNTL